MFTKIMKKRIYIIFLPEKIIIFCNNVIIIAYVYKTMKLNF